MSPDQQLLLKKFPEGTFTNQSKKTGEQVKLFLYFLFTIPLNANKICGVALLDPRIAAKAPWGQGNQKLEDVGEKP